MRNEWLRDITSLGGAPIYIAMIIIGFYLDLQLFLRLIVGFVFSYLFVVPFRVAFFKKRPDNQKYSNWMNKIDASSFPSHHAVRGTILWLLMASFFNDAPFWIVAVIAIAAISYTRVLLKRHHAKDAVGGIVLGAIAFLIIIFLDNYAGFVEVISALG